MIMKTNKGLNTKMYLSLIYIIFGSIYLSWWIANLGVVPLLLFAAFLLLPALVFLRALLFFVTRVFDTISILLKRKQLCELRRIKYLPRLLSSVKDFAFLFLIILLPLQAKIVKPLENQTLILSIGGIRELHLPSLDRYTLGNNDSLSHKFNAKKKQLLIKAKKIGLTELHIWKKDGNRKVYQIYVLSRNNLLKLLSLAESLKTLDLTVETRGPWVYVAGELLRVDDYKRFLKILFQNKEKLQVQVTLTKKLQKTLLAKVIKSLFNDHISDFKCQFIDIELICHLSNERTPSPEVETYLKDKLGVRFIRHLSKNLNKNYRLKVKIIQIESSDGSSQGFALQQLSGSLEGIFNQGWQTLYEKNQITLKNLGIEASLLAEPITLIRPNRKVVMQVGSEIPYTTTNKNGEQNTKFKFAGLKLNLLLKKEGSGFLIDYSAEITKPGLAGEISGSKESASARISPGEPLELFEISFQTDAIDKESLPIMGKIPILGTLFRNETKSKSFKKITGLILLEER